MGHTDAVWAAIAHPFYATSALLVSTGSDGTAKIWDGKLLKHSFRKETATPLCAAWLKTSPSKTAVGYDDGTVSLYDAFAGKEVASFGSGARIEGLACHPNLPLVLAACSDGTVKVYETTTANHVHTFETQFDGATAIDVNPDGLTFACGGVFKVLSRCPAT